MAERHNSELEEGLEWSWGGRKQTWETLNVFSTFIGWSYGLMSNTVSFISSALSGTITWGPSVKDFAQEKIAEIDNKINGQVPTVVEIPSRSSGGSSGDTILNYGDRWERGVLLK